MRRAVVSRCVACGLGVVIFAGCSRNTPAGDNRASEAGAAVTAAPASPAAAAAGAAGANANAPWYPSLAAFEHYDSTRARIFSQATFGGGFDGKNTVGSQQSPAGQYPSGWNVTFLDADNMFLYGGGAGNEASSTGAWVAKVDAATLQPVWSRQLINTQQTGEWDYPGASAILEDGMLYVIYGYHLAKVDPQNGDVVATLTLPTGDAAPANTTYNGFSATAAGVIVAKPIFRQPGCTEQGGNALVQCPDSPPLPSSVLVTVDPKAMKVLHTVTMPGEVLGRVCIGRYQGKDYAYIFAQSGFIRYEISPAGAITLDPSWSTAPVLTSGQTIGWSLIPMGDWVVTQSNGLPASVPSTAYAVHQGDASKRFTMQPFANDPIPPVVKAAYRKQAPGGTQAVSFVISALSADAQSNMIYMFDALPGKIAALRVTPSGLEMVWKVSQATTEFLPVVGPPDHRVLVTTAIPGAEIPGANKHDEVVWRDAATGAELARSAKLPAITGGTMVQPAYAGNVFYPTADGTLYKLMPAPQSH